MATIPSASIDDGVARLQIERSVTDPGHRVCAALADLDWLGTPVQRSAAHPELRRIATDLGFAMSGGDRPITLRKAAYVDVGPLQCIEGGCSATIAWQASTLAPLFPVFAGRLESTEDRLLLVGAYAPPGGGVGLLVDRAILRIVATRTAAGFLDQLVTRLDGR
jgi:hypothetical protein